MKMKNWMRSAGFTLVELIVVIAVLGILGAGAAVGYSGYVKKANKAMDQQMVTEMVHALQMSALVESDFPSDATILLSTEKAVAVGDGAAAVMQSIYGSGWADACTLKYGKWALGDTIVIHAQQLANKLGDNTLSYVNDVDELWDEVEYILGGLETTQTMNDVYGGDAGLMNAAAKYTAVKSSDSQKTYADADAFAAAWADGSKVFERLGDAYNASGDKNSSALDPMLAKCAAIKARNYAFGNYLKSIAGLESVAVLVQDCSSGLSVGGVKVPEDFLKALNTSSSETYKALGKLNMTAAQKTSLENAIKNYYGATTSTTSEGIMGFKIDSYPAVDAAKNTQAYRDGLGYYTLMQAIADCENDTKGMSNDEYKSTMASAVSNTGALLKADETTRNAMSGGCVSVSVKKSDDGSAIISVDPAELYLGDSLQGNDTVTVTVEYDGANDVPMFSKSGDFVLKRGQSGTIKFVPGETLSSIMGTQKFSTVLKNLFGSSTFGYDETILSVEQPAERVRVKVSKNANSASAQISVSQELTIDVSIVD